MVKQKLIWTSLPNGYTLDGKSLRVSVLLSPRLNPESALEQLGTFPSFHDWPDTLHNATYEIHCGGSKITLQGLPLEGSNRVDGTVGLPDSDTWKALFPLTTYVRGFEFKDLSNNQIVSYDTRAVSSLVHDLYKNLARMTDGNMPSISEIMDSGWGPVVDAVTSLDTEKVRIPISRYFSYTDDKSDDEKEKAIQTVQTLGQFQHFHTPPAEPKSIEPQARDDDKRIEVKWREYEHAELPDKTDFANTIDFHQIVASMNNYPTILRRLGLVIDFILDAKKFTKSDDQLLWVNVNIPDGTPPVTPKTHVNLSECKFTAVSSPNLYHDDFQIVDGLLNLKPEQFDLLQFDVDGAGFKVINFARSLRRYIPENQRLDPIKKIEQESGAPSLRNAGLMLVHTNRWQMLKNKLDSNKKMNDSVNVIAPELWSEDIVRGFRIDIWDGKTNVWRSLCERKAEYNVGNGVSISIDEEEGIVRLAATKPAGKKIDESNLIYLHEALVSWTGWSLCAPPPGRVIGIDDSVDKTKITTEAELPPGLQFISSYKPVKHSLPRLRYGRKYWIRARAVDLTGNSLSPRWDDFGVEDTKKRARHYLRHEPVSAPVVTLVQTLEDHVTRPAEGESMERIAIRSFNEIFDDPTPTTQTASRYILPPQSSIKDAEYHGMLDSSGGVDNGKFTMLQNVKPFDECLKIVQDYPALKEGTTLSYLPDPMAEKVSIRIFDHPNISDTEITQIPLYPKSEWPKAEPFKIHVYEHPTERPQYNESNRTLMVPLPKAIRAKMRLSMQLSPDVLNKMGIWHWLDDKDKANLYNLTLNGQHWMLTPWRTIELLNAVQRPLIAPTISKLTVTREHGKTHSQPEFLTTCSLKSTDHLDLRAEWHEPSDDPTQSNSMKQQADLARGDLAFSVKISDTNSYGGIAEHLIVGQDLISVNLIPHDLVKKKYHEFHDTRYRRIEYWLEATSSFREYMPKDILEETVTINGEANEPTDERIKVMGSRKVTWVPNSAPPPAPDVLYIVPTYGWIRKKDEKGNSASWRRGGGLRVYLNRPWNTSGYGEMLGVILPPASFQGDPSKVPSENPYQDYVTQWGNDPIWKSPSIAGVSPKQADFPLARTAPDPTGAWLPKDALKSERDQPPGNFNVNDLLLSSPLESANIEFNSIIKAANDIAEGERIVPRIVVVDVAPHDVFYDEIRQLWYCDIEINPGASYYPFIRMALARYQPVSVNYAHISNIILADIMPLASDRWLNVLQDNKDKKKRHVALYGYSYSDSSGHTEVEKPAWTKIQPKKEAKTPADISGTSIIKVWVERLDRKLGEDFGWKLEPEATIQPTSRLKQICEEKVYTYDVERAKELLKDRKFDELLRDRLIEKVLPSTLLWEGNVTLPSRHTEKTRYRLVIGEYEEYLVDDEDPYDKVPKKKGQRLVFVEHVELS